VALSLYGPLVVNSFSADRLLGACARYGLLFVYKYTCGRFYAYHFKRCTYAVNLGLDFLFAFY